MIATIRVWRQQHHHSVAVYIIGGAIIAALILLAWAGDVAAERRRTAAAEAAQPGGAAEPGTALEPSAASAGAVAFPVPPLDLPHYHGIGVAGSPAGSAPAAPDTGDAGPDAVTSGTVKEVTGA